MRRLLRAFMSHHQFFHSVSKRFIGGYTLGDVRLYPLAWVRFMWASRRDIARGVIAVDDYA